MKRWIVRITLMLVLGAITTVAVAWGLASTDERELAALTHQGFVDYGDTHWVYQINRTSGRLRIDSQASEGSRHDELMRESAANWEAQGFPTVAVEDLPRWSRVRKTFPQGSFEDSMLGAAVESASGFPALAFRCTIFDASIGARRNFASVPGVVITTDEIQRTDRRGNRTSIRIAPGDGIEDGHLVDVSFDGNGFPLTVQTLPFRPIWPGFAIDTLFYAAIWFGVFFGFASAKRFIRAKRGRCPRCGYDLRGHRHQGIEAPRYQGGGAGCPECGWNRENGTSI